MVDMVYWLPILAGLCLLIILLLTKRLTWHLVQKLQGRVRYTKKDDVFGRQRKKTEGQRHQHEVTKQTSTSSYVI